MDDRFSARTSLFVFSWFWCIWRTHISELSHCLSLSLLPTLKILHYLWIFRRQYLNCHLWRFNRNMFNFVQSNDYLLLMEKCTKFSESFVQFSWPFVINLATEISWLVDVLPYLNLPMIYKLKHGRPSLEWWAHDGLRDVVWSHCIYRQVIVTVKLYIPLCYHIKILYKRLIFVKVCIILGGGVDVYWNGILWFLYCIMFVVTLFSIYVVPKKFPN